MNIELDLVEIRKQFELRYNFISFKREPDGENYASEYTQDLFDSWVNSAESLLNYINTNYIISKR